MRRYRATPRRAPAKAAKRAGAASPIFVRSNKIGMNFLGSSNGNDAPRAGETAPRDGGGDKRPGRWPTQPDYWRLWVVGTLQFGIRWLDTLAIAVFAYQHTGSA